MLAAVVVRGDQQPTEMPGVASVKEAAAAGHRGHASALLLTGFFIGNALIGLYDEAVYQHVYAHGKALGLSGPKAVSVISAVSLTYIIGGVGGGILSDLIGRRRILVMAALGAAASLLLLATSSPAALWLWAGAFGLALGMSTAVRSAAWADAFAGPQLGRNVGIVTPGYSVGAAIATYGGASWLETGGSFQALYTAAAGAAFLWAILGAMLTRSGPLPQGVPHVVRSVAYPPHAQKISTAQQPEL
ncbi:MAG: MFS transporter [candidate division NC10 bacterium]|nr:MFS transporter [candidate division NC10 bacterium]